MFPISNTTYILKNSRHPKKSENSPIFWIWKMKIMNILYNLGTVSRLLGFLQRKTCLNRFFFFFFFLRGYVGISLNVFASRWDDIARCQWLAPRNCFVSFSVVVFLFLLFFFIFDWHNINIPWSGCLKIDATH